tara:strand:- start:499 stop:921 length:423 start_codon:yes stop_codon:yes gene_type:complete
VIKYILKCENSHEFESWFSDSHEFDKLKRKKLLECIYCSSEKIHKSIMSPMIRASRSENKNNIFIDKKILNEKNKLLSIRKYVEKNFEFVGDKFSKKAREVYYDKKSKKGIYGKTTKVEREALADEGIDLLSIPWIRKDN